ncbi:HAD family hydrolase [Streptomyces sp. SP18CS02]|uniref:HAD family hydrolase n=1 Tax=Streptomyces sp. SP18CS02 TaxID=3002531 RepID=UPI002E7A4293|nr:HAD family hydrolase [Streptomyces sp. SP18CS02]MEE1754203.1 HAD family hydrolase [Streptomyces sp. SP18CS02]
MRSDGLAGLLSDCDAILFDFDGPICDVFRGLPAPGVARELADLLVALAPHLGDAARSTEDPMEVHRLSAQGGEAVLAAVEAALTEAEVRAVKVAGPPVHGAAEALKAAKGSGHRVAVVSNNSADCVRAYLADHGLSGVVEQILGRPTLRPDLMKPSPYPLLEAASHLGTAPERTVLIGDSVTDIEAARAAATRSIGFANKPAKENSLANAGADEVVLNMMSVTDALSM